MKTNKYPGMPKSFDRGSDGSLKYPDRESYYKALKAYAKHNKIDPDSLITEWENYIKGCYKTAVTKTK